MLHKFDLFVSCRCPQNAWHSTARGVLPHGGDASQYPREPMPCSLSTPYRPEVSRSYARSCPMASSTVDGEAWSPYDDHHPDLAMPPRLDACPPRGSRPSTDQSTARRPSPYRPPGDGDLTRQHTQHDPDLGLRTEHRWSPRDTSPCPQTPSHASTTSPPESLTRDTSPSNQKPSSPLGKRPKPA